MNDVNSNQSLTLKEGGNTAITELINEPTLARLTFDVKSRNLVEKNELSAGEDLLGTVDIVLVDSLYHLQRDRNEDHANYDVFEACDLKDVSVIREI